MQTASPKGPDKATEKEPINEVETESRIKSDISNKSQKKFASRLVLVDDNPGYKRYRFVMKKREQVNIEWAGTDRIKGVKQEDAVDKDLENIQEYLAKGYAEDEFDPRSTLMTRTREKITVVREGKETELDVYERK